MCKQMFNDLMFHPAHGKGLVCIHIGGSLNKFPDFFRIDTFIDSTHMKF